MDHNKDNDTPFTAPKKDETPFSRPDNDTPFTPPVITKSKRSRKGLWTTLALLIVLTGAGLLAYLWMAEKNRADDLNSQVNSLTEQVGTTQDSDEEPASTTTQYKAEVGKFTLTLPSTYAILLNLDGAYEGGPATALQVGKKNATNTSVIDFKLGEQVSIGAYVAANQGIDFDAWVTAQLGEGGQQTALPNIKVDGVDAKVYQLDGIPVTRTIFFTKNGLFYNVRVEGATDENKAGLQVLSDVTKGFKFDS